MRLAELWLDEVCAFPAGHASRPRPGAAPSGSRPTLPAWRALVDPVAGKVVDSMGSMLTGEGGPMAQLGAMPEQAAALAGPMQQMMRSIGGAMFGTQIGQAIGGLALEVVGSTDVGLPLTTGGVAALLPANVSAFGDGLEVPDDQVRLYLALREAAHQRLFAHVPWLQAHLVDAVAAYARGITVDTARLEEAVGSIDPSDPGLAAGGAHRRAVRARGHPGAEGRARPARDRARAGRGLGRRGRRRRRHLAAAGRVRAARDRTTAARQRRPGRGRPSPPWSGSSCGRGGCGRRRPCGGRCSPTAASTAATPSGPTPT